MRQKIPRDSRGRTYRADQQGSAKHTPNHGTPAVATTIPAILTYAQRLVFIGGLLGLLCAINYFLGAAAFHDLNSCVDCYEIETSIDKGLASGGFFYPPLLLPPFTWLVFEDKAHIRKASIYICGLLNILQRLVFYLEHSGEINHVRLGSRCYLWASLSWIHILTFSMTYAVAQLFLATSTAGTMGGKPRSFCHVAIATSGYIGLIAGLAQLTARSHLVIDFVFVMFGCTGLSLFAILISARLRQINDIEASGMSHTQVL